MQATHPELFCDLGDQLLAADLGFGIRQPVADRHGHREQEKVVAIELPEFDYVSPAELIEDLEFTAISPTIESQLKDELGPIRFSRLMKLLFQVWQIDRMI